MGYQTLKEVDISKIDMYPVITLCGSTKFKQEFELWERKLTLNGFIVLTCGLFNHAEGLNITAEQKQMLDDMHLRKIDMSVGIFVIDKDMYIGESTNREIEYAKNNNKIVLYMSDFDLEGLI